MIRATPELARFERWYALERDLPHDRALEMFTALWCEARLLDPNFPGDWREDLEPDLAVARAVNGLPPDA
ncbi:MAG TPA: hypothetical protein VGA70_09490 [Longimicrobiales bacterium]|jgi:hypothetical protein